MSTEQPAPLVASCRTRAICPVCRRDFPLMRDGGFWPHGTNPTPQSSRCAGSLNPPGPDTEET